VQYGNKYMKCWIAEKTHPRPASARRCPQSLL
jgi:hypothetical protein